MEELSLQQQRIYKYILQFTEENGYPPSVREIAQAVGLKSPSTVHFHLKGLEEAGAITRSSGKGRAITAVRPAEDAPPHRDGIPLLGTVAAGTPILAEQNVEDYIAFDAPDPDELFALRIRGDSMIMAGILPDDLVIVRRQSTARQGEIVIALLGDEATCKRLDLRRGHVWLLPENPDYSPIDGADAVILGKVVGLQRRY